MSFHARDSWAASPSSSRSPATPPRNSPRPNHARALRQSPRHKLHSSPRSASGKRLPSGKTPPKAKRKKTRPEDKAILEAAYEQNPTPDKLARRDLASRCMDMTEGRIQIWFQNRRQIDRRRSDPIPSKVEAFTHGRIQVLSPDILCHKNKSFEVDTLAVAATNPTASLPDYDPISSAYAQAASCYPSSEPGDAREAYSEAKAGSWKLMMETARPSLKTVAPAPRERPGEPRPVLSRSFSGATGYLSNRRNAGGSSSQPQYPASQESLRFEPPSSSCPPAISSGADSESLAARLRSERSRFCLSMSLDGRAELTQASSSPPRPDNSQSEDSGPVRLALADSVLLPPLQFPDPITASRNPRRSLPGGPLVNNAAQSRPFPMPSSPRMHPWHGVEQVNRPRLNRCRSRDVQAWEDCANSENREDPLIRQAKHESSGSAVAAINLVRSTSGSSGSALKQRSSNVRRRSPAQSGVAKRYKPDGLSSSRTGTRTVLSPGKKHNAKLWSAEEYLGGAKPSSGTVTSFWNNDSDKENWSPDEDGNARSFRRVATTASSSSSGRRPLPSAPLAVSKLDANRNPRRTSAQVPRATSLQRGDTEPGSWASSSRRYRPKPSLRQSLSQSAVDVFEDPAEEEEDDDDDDDNEVGRDAACKQLRSMCGVSPSKDKDMAAVSGLLSLKYARP